MNDQGPPITTDFIGANNFLFFLSYVPFALIDQWQQNSQVPVRLEPSPAFPDADDFVLYDFESHEIIEVFKVLSLEQLPLQDPVQTTIMLNHFMKNSYQLGVNRCFLLYFYNPGYLSYYSWLLTQMRSLDPSTRIQVIDMTHRDTKVTPEDESHIVQMAQKLAQKDLLKNSPLAQEAYGRLLESRGCHQPLPADRQFLKGINLNLSPPSKNPGYSLVSDISLRTQNHSSFLSYVPLVLMGPWSHYNPHRLVVRLEPSPAFPDADDFVLYDFESHEIIEVFKVFSLDHYALQAPPQTVFSLDRLMTTRSYHQLDVNRCFLLYFYNPGYASYFSWLLTQMQSFNPSTRIQVIDMTDVDAQVTPDMQTRKLGMEMLELQGPEDLREVRLLAQEAYDRLLESLAGPFI